MQPFRLISVSAPPPPEGVTGIVFLKYSVCTVRSTVIFAKCDHCSFLYEWVRLLGRHKKKMSELNYWPFKMDSLISWTFNWTSRTTIFMKNEKSVQWANMQFNENNAPNANYILNGHCKNLCKFMLSSPFYYHKDFQEWVHSVCAANTYKLQRYTTLSGAQASTNLFP